MDLELKGRSFLITGGTDGLGLALAKKLVDEGAQVGVCGRDAGRLEQAQQLLGGESLCFKADVTNESDLDSFIDATMSKFGGLDGAVNNAGKSAGTPIATSDEDMWREDYELKVLSAVHVSRRVLPALELSKGAIVNVLAIMARTPGASSTPTTASRAAGLALTKAMSNEVGPRGVRVKSGQWVRKAAEAGITVEEFMTNMAKDSRIPLGRMGRAGEFADLASFLLSPRASYITGVGINLDGGLSPVI